MFLRMLGFNWKTRLLVALTILAVLLILKLT